MASRKRKKIATTNWSFERALKELRRGVPVRRRAWHSESQLVRCGKDVFVMLPGFTGLRAPQVWKPYAEDFFGRDWEISGAA